MRRLWIYLVLLAIAGCSDDVGLGSSNIVQKQLESATAAGATSFNFAADSSFAWDRLFVFAPYATQSDVEAALGFQWPAYRQTSIERSDSICLVVFVQGGRIVHWFEQSRSIDLCKIANKKGYDRSQAVFSVARADGRFDLTPIAGKD